MKIFVATTVMFPSIMATFQVHGRMVYVTDIFHSSIINRRIDFISHLVVASMRAMSTVDKYSTIYVSRVVYCHLTNRSALMMRWRGWL